MPKGTDSKLRLFRLVEYFEQMTDSNHFVTRKNVEDHLKTAWKTTVDRKTFENDLMCLDTLGYEIEHPENSHQYKLVSRPFAFSELKMIIDCLLSARTLDEKTTQRLIKTLKKECSKYEGETLDRQVIVANRVKTTNKVVHYALDEIQTAIQAECQISFKYFDYDMKMKRTYRKNGETYYVSPFVVVYSDENHYLLGYDGEKVRPYRIDRMEGVKAEKAMPRQGQEVFEEKIDLDHYRQYTFGMYDGKVETVRLRFFYRMMNTVIDKFGSDVVVYKVNDEHFEIEVPVAVSPQFFGWIFGLGGQVQIMSPKPVVRKMKEMLKKVGDKYKA